MTTLEPAILESTLRDAGTGWLVDSWGAEKDRHLSDLARDLGDFQRRYRDRYGEVPDPVALLGRDPIRGAAFLDADTLQLSASMKIAVWRILHDCEIVRVDFQYRKDEESNLNVTLLGPDGQVEQHEWLEGGDFRFLRHIGATGHGNSYHLEGYYAFK